MYMCALLSLLRGRHTSCAAGVAFACCVSQQACVVVVHVCLGRTPSARSFPPMVAASATYGYSLGHLWLQVCAPSESSGMYSVAAHALFWAALMPMQACNHSSGRQ